MIQCRIHLGEPEKVIFDEPIIQKGFLGRSHILPPTKKPHFSKLQITENYKVSKVHLIINPFSGRKKGLEVAKEVKAGLSESKIKVESHVTEASDHAISLVKNLSLVKGDAIVSIGGDGTFCEVITGFMLRNDKASETFPLDFN